MPEENEIESGREHRSENGRSKKQVGEVNKW